MKKFNFLVDLDLVMIWHKFMGIHNNDVGNSSPVSLFPWLFPTIFQNISHFPISFEIIVKEESRRSRCRKRQVPKKK